MKKTYIVPELENYKITTMAMLALSTTDDVATAEDNPRGNLSKGWGGSLWDDDTED